ncbi:unnamed protein product [Bursaphelenchus okinawaensis]|uniref:F-box domain-containing protein n=1 Tax=Bursaphelenchus okinawaensis TaxID=465554 RepID=A0A811LCL8_9BILA|nr:unnamed protein product [Bursaphelenchus okinawaensis]CAG9120646.1 unnamed protein product [Bursaphelenchus okinawaensis]
MASRAKYEPQNSPLSLIRTPKPDDVIKVSKSVFYVFTDRFCRAICMDWKRGKVSDDGKYVFINSEDLVRGSALCEDEKKLSALLYRQLFHYLPNMLKETKWRLIILKEVEHILTSRWCVTSRRLARIIFLTRAFFLIEFYQKWLIDELDLEDEKFRYSMSGQGYQDLFCAVRMETGVYYYQSFLSDNFGFPNDSCFSHIARSIVYSITDILKRKDGPKTFKHFLQLADVPKEQILGYLNTTDLLSLRLVNKEMKNRVDRTLVHRKPFVIDKTRFQQVSYDNGEVTIKLNIPQQRFFPSSSCTLTPEYFINHLNKFNVMKQLHFLTPWLLKTYRFASFSHLTAQTNKFEAELVAAVLHDLPKLKVVKIAYTCSLSNDQLERIKSLISTSQFEIDSITTNVIVLHRSKLTHTIDSPREDDECSPVKKGRFCFRGHGEFSREL